MSIYDQGRVAYRRNIPLHKCPYTDTACRDAWINGWYDEQAEFMAS
jgi:ribosome modulation factor